MWSPGDRCEVEVMEEGPGVRVARGLSLRHSVRLLYDVRT